MKFYVMNLSVYLQPRNSVQPALDGVTTLQERIVEEALKLARRVVGLPLITLNIGTNQGSVLLSTTYMGGKMPLICRLTILNSILILAPARFLSADNPKRLPHDTSFGMMHATTSDVACMQAEVWLQSVGKTDYATIKAFNAIWHGERTVLDKVADTFALGDHSTAQLLASSGRDFSCTDLGT